MKTLFIGEEYYNISTQYVFMKGVHCQIMDLFQWGNEYLQEAEKIKNHIDHLKTQLTKSSLGEARSINSRICILYSMYLDCKGTGDILHTYSRER